VYIFENNVSHCMTPVHKPYVSDKEIIMSAFIPSEMRAIQLENYDKNLAIAIHSLKVVTEPVPQPDLGQVLIRIEAAPCNPSDLVFLQGLYGIKKTLPSIPGWEGSGTVITSGGGVLGGWLKGKRVACGSLSDSDGTWAEYMVAEAKNCVPLSSKISFEQGAPMLVNPLTALALVETARKKGHKAIVQTAASSQLGRMILHLATTLKIPIINIVRRDDQADLLTSMGAKVVLNSEVENFTELLREECSKLNPTIVFDPVAGEMTGRIIGAMAPRSEAVVYGSLSESPCSGIDAFELIFGQKTVTGFWLSKWIQERGFVRIFRATNRVQRLIADGSFSTKVRMRLPLEEVPYGLLKYHKRMTDGKILIIPARRGD
jgi:NADPH:quinone reductase-like Zn-dependent oxidoreductase